MKNRIEKKFFELRKNKQKALVTFITSGDPNQKISKKILNILPNVGVDLIEIGIPFSDPMADGPIIQKSSQRAISSGTTLETTFNLVEGFRKSEKDIPIILMGYFNPIFQYGLKKFFKNCRLIGIDGLIIVDLPPEENEYIEKYTKEFDIHNIRLLTPTTDKKRLKKILKSTNGFLYYISIMGITGTKRPSVKTVEKSVKKIKKMTNLPIVIGFGINNKTQINGLNKFSDGCVVGSAVIKIIEEFHQGKITEKKMLANISDFLANLKK
ncbi:MAG: tryptophan synthase subunit alpha [Pseudomonadota bacterium]|nr:tryptophan synthase subunit alpha [Pseudomonadota bacterium]